LHKPSNPTVTAQPYFLVSLVTLGILALLFSIAITFLLGRNTSWTHSKSTQSSELGKENSVDRDNQQPDILKSPTLNEPKPSTLVDRARDSLPNAYKSPTSLADKEELLRPEELFARVSPAVVQIEVFDKRETVIGQGSGFFVDESGGVITNAHVAIADGAHHLVVRLKNDTEYVVTTVQSVNRQMDLALLRLNVISPTRLRLSESLPSVGARVFAVGNPIGLRDTFSEGIVSGIRSVSDYDRIQTTAAISPGSSGGPLVNETGNAVGVTTSGYTVGQSLNFAVPSTAVIALLDGDVRPQAIVEVARPVKPEIDITASSSESRKARGASAKEFAKIHEQFKQLNAEIDAILEKFPNALSVDERKTLSQKYGELAKRGKELIPKLRSVAQAAYLAAPNKDADVVEVLLGMTASHLYEDDYAAALKLTNLLMDNGCKEKGLQNMAGLAAFCTHDFANAEKLLTAAKDAGELDQSGQIYLADVEKTNKLWAAELAAQAAEAKANDLPWLKIETSKGDIVVELFENEAPQTVGNFINLVEKKFYDGLTFHRVLPNFMAQGGCPDGTGSGGPGYNIYCECEKENHRNHFSGSLSMAHAGKDTGGSQFYITFRPTPHLDGKHTVFGRVIGGMDVLPKLQRIDPSRSGGPPPDQIVKAIVLRKRDHKYEPTVVE